MFSKSCKYAIRAVLYLATRLSEGEKIGAKSLGELLKVPTPFLAKILQDLSRKGLISSTKGPGGGFFLSEENQNVTLEQIIECVDGPEVMHGCVLGFSTCSSANPCPLHVQAFAYREGLRYQLAHQTVRELALRINREKIKL
ncbi:MAG: Rrf2 family transcriptional regulator [Bacteroidia bacterium]|nr:Rrf2 family transcriptional regulator [Bacteroidia bacterium]